MPRKSAGLVGVVVAVVVAASVGASGFAQDRRNCASAGLLASPTGEATAAPGTDAMADTPVWQTVTLTDACTGEPFTLADFVGRPVYVEAMATWCPTCRKQLDNVRAAREQLEDEEFVLVALSTEVDLQREDLAAYAESGGYDWIFAVMTPDMLQALVDDFGRSVSVPPSTPHFIIGPDGAATELKTGIEEADDLVEDLAAARGGSSA